MGIIDIHTHLPLKSEVLDQRDQRMIERDGIPLSDKRPIERILQEMDEARIDRAVVLSPPPIESFNHSNEALAEDIKHYSERLFGFGSVNPYKEKDPAGTVRYCVEKLGFRGIGEFGCFDYTDPICFPIYEACIELDIPILIHMGAPLPSVPLKYGHPNLLDEIVIRYPELKVIAAHCGAPWFNELAVVAFRHENVWIDVSALSVYPFLMRYLAFSTMLAAELGERLLYGSDFPVTNTADWAKWVQSFSIPFPLRNILKIPKFEAQHRHALLEGNAKKLLKL